MKLSFDLVTPMHNECENIFQLVATVRSSSIQPNCWVIVDDHSTDNSEWIASALIKDMKGVAVIKREEKDPAGWLGYGKVVGCGLDHLSRHRIDAFPDYVGVVDADVALQSDYFERLVTTMNEKPSAAIATGLIGETTDKGSTIWRPSGAARLYRRRFLEMVGGFPVYPSPDSALSIKARNRGLEIVIVAEARAVHAPKKKGQLGTSRSRNTGRSGRACGLDLLSMLLIAARIAADETVRDAIAYMEGWLTFKREDVQVMPDMEIVSFYNGLWKDATKNWIVSHAESPTKLQLPEAESTAIIDESRRSI